MSLYPETTRFESVTIVLPVINETFSLRQSVEIVLKNLARSEIRELLIVVCKKTTPAALRVVEELSREYGDLVAVLQQKRPFLGGALRDAFDAARGSHVIIMSSDLETNPNEAHLLVAQARAHPDWVITTSRWIEGGSFTGYSTLKLICNWIFQRFFSLLYFTRLSDMTYGYRIFPTKLVQAIEWEELRHPFNLESMVKPLRLGVPALEIPSVWTARSEGESQNPFFRNFEYFRTGFKVRFASRRSLLKPEFRN